MNTLKRNFIIILFILSTKTFAQSDFVKGYVLTNNHDTLNGYLKQNVEGNLLKTVYFSNSENGSSSQEYSPTDVTAFYFAGGNLFESVQFTDMDNSRVIYFAKLLLKGYYNLYSFRKNDLQYFIIKHEDETYLLYDDILLSSGSYDTKGNYENQFLFLSRNCSKLTTQIPQLRYSESDFASFVHKINTCVAPENASYTVAVKPKSKTNLYVYGAALPLGDKYEFTGRALVRISTPSISKNLSLNAGLSYLAHKEEESSTSQNNVVNIFNAGLTMQNNFTTGIIQPYFEAGIGVSYKQEKNSAHQISGFQDEYGVDFIIAIGIEGYVTKKLAIKADWRYELLMHYPVIGLAYFF